MAEFTISRRRLMLASAGLISTGLAVGAPAFAQQRPIAGPVPGLAIDPALDPSGGITAWIDAFGRPTAAVSVNGRGPFRFLVDTGATTTVIAARRAAEMGLNPAGVMMVNGATGAAEAPQAIADEVLTGTIRKAGLRVALMDRGSMERWDGVLGADMFVGRRLEFDIPAKTVTLTQGAETRGASKASRAAGQGFQLRNGALAELDGAVGRVDVKLILDTGADCSIANPSLSRALLKMHRGLRRDPNAALVGVTGDRLSGEGIALPPVLLGNVLAEGAIAIAADAPIFKVWGLERQPALLVGVDLLSQLQRFSIDYRALVFQATPMATLMSQGGTALG